MSSAKGKDPRGSGRGPPRMVTNSQLSRCKCPLGSGPAGDFPGATDTSAPNRTFCWMLVVTRPRPDSGAQARGLNRLTHWCWWSGRAGSGGSDAIPWVGLVSRVPLHRPWGRPPADSPRGRAAAGAPPRGSNPPRFQLQPHTRSGPSAGTRTGCHQSPRVTDGRLRSLLSPSPLWGSGGSCGPPFPEGLGSESRGQR